MDIDTKGKIFVIVGPSGSGKSTLIQKIKQNIPSLCWSVSCTTRKMRTGEINGVDYFFLTQEEFQQKKELGELIEWAKVHDNFYGTLHSTIQSQTDAGHFLLLDIDIQGADSLRKKLPSQTVIIFLAPPSLSELEKRLRKRKTDDEENIQTRLRNARREMSKKNDYDHFVINDDPQRSYHKLHDIITGYM